MRLIKLTLTGMLVIIAGSCTENKPPNIVFILVDDLGWTDLNCYHGGGFYETPNIDGLARSGTMFTSAYTASPVCSPTRASIMTGKYPTRIDATNFFSGARSEKFHPAPLHSNMPVDEITIAESLRLAGYKTAFIGKWHLGPSEEFWPEAQGLSVIITKSSLIIVYVGLFVLTSVNIHDRLFPVLPSS